MNCGPPPIETAYSPISWGWDDLQDSRPDSPLDFDKEPEQCNPWSFLDAADLTDLGQRPVDSVGAEATMGHGQLPLTRW